MVFRTPTNMPLYIVLEKANLSISLSPRFTINIVKISTFLSFKIFVRLVFLDWVSPLAFHYKRHNEYCKITLLLSNYFSRFKIYFYESAKSNPLGKISFLKVVQCILLLKCIHLFCHKLKIDILEKVLKFRGKSI